MAAELTILNRTIGDDHPTYFIADIGANHDGDLDRAKRLIELAADAGADAAKFQNFEADTIVSERGFRQLGPIATHQSRWDKSVYDVYRDASLDSSWTPVLRNACEAAGIHYFTSPYSPEIVDAVEPYVPAFKIGSGDIAWLEELEHIAKKGKPVILATGAATTDDVVRAVAIIRRWNSSLALLQCNTNYTGSIENLRFVNLRVLQTYRSMFRGLVLGLSDHTPGHATVLGAVALGARIIEKHFTDDPMRSGPDHAFAMSPAAWREMVDRTRELEAALGDGIKRIEENEREALVVQRRALRTVRALQRGTTLAATDLRPLRPWTPHSIGAEHVRDVVGRTLASDVAEGAELHWSDIAG